MASVIFSLVFSLGIGITKGVLKIIRKKNNKHNKTFTLAKTKLNSIETLISQALIDLEINHEEFKRIINEEEHYGRLKEDIKMMKSNDELSENNKILKKIMKVQRIKTVFF